MVYYHKGMELEVISEVFRGSVNDVLICRDQLSAAGALYTVLAVHDRACIREMLQILESSQRGGEPVYTANFTQNETMLFVLPYREQRRFSDFAEGQITSLAVSETICVNLVMECLSCHLPWPLLYLVFKQDQIHIAKDNSVYFGHALDLKDLRAEVTERECIVQCANRLLVLLYSSKNNRPSRKQLKSYELIRKKVAKSGYQVFPELYRDIKFTALPQKKISLKKRLLGIWRRNQDTWFKILVALCVVLVIITAIMLISQLIYGEIPLLRLFQHGFDVIGTENLHQGGRS